MSFRLLWRMVNWLHRQSGQPENRVNCARQSGKKNKVSTIEVQGKTNYEPGVERISLHPVFYEVFF